MECPCRDCSNRKLGCHSVCELYKNWRSDKDKMNHNIRHNKEQDWIGRLGVHYKKNCKR